MIKASSINKCWEKSMKYFLLNANSREICGKEYFILEHLSVQARNYIFDQTLSDFCLWQLKNRDYYLSQVSMPGKNSEMKRLYSYGPSKINQYDNAINVLKKRKNIKPIVICIYDPSKDNRDYVPTPCINNILLDLYDGIINMHVSYSTINLFRMGLLDCHQMAYLHHKIAYDSGKKVGLLTIDSFQVYMPLFDYIISRQIFGVNGNL